MAEGWPEARHYALAAVVLVAVGVLGGGIFIWSGLYNVSAAKQHFDVTTALLDVVRRRSVATHSIGIKVPPMAPDDIALGARYFDQGCAPCHGAPGRKASAITPAMLPAPPPLGTVAEDWSTAELFWIVHNGQKYTGMPGWPAPDREDEVWPVVAFLKELPAMEAGSYDMLAGGARAPADAVGLGRERNASLVESCGRCHGGPGERPISELVPSLSGQKVEYLRRALQEYREGARPSGMMQLLAADLGDDEIDQIAQLYAAAPATGSGTGDAGPESRGELIATRGLPAAGVPACLGCHSGDRRPDFPRLAGQPARYLATQLRLWQEGLRDDTAHGAIMSRIAKRLPPEDIADVANYLQSLGPAEGGAR